MGKCDCAICKHQHDFEVPKDLVDDLISGRLVLFTGAGISTESRDVLRFTFYDEIAGELKKGDCTLSFPELMEEYCRQVNGRIKLLEKIRKRFQHIRSFPEMTGVATRFHSELSTIFQLNTIITTNWDNYFEVECDAIPFVSDQDLVFWETTDRKVMKIHGSINNYGSIVATTKDYENCQARLHSGLIGSVLKSILATKTIVFIGYSLSDSDFNNVFSFVSEQMKDFQRQAYVITPFSEEKAKFEELGLIPIVTDGTYFLSQLKQHLVTQEMMLPDSFYGAAYNLYSKVMNEHILLHDKYKCFDHPQMIIASSYQDGMIHALGRIDALMKSGKYSDPCYIHGVFKPYLEWRDKKLKSKIYEDVAYIEGYLNAMIFLSMDEGQREELESPPLYYAFGVKEEIYTLEEYSQVIMDLPSLHKASYKRTMQMVSKLKSTSGVAFHHPPWL